MLSVFTLDHIDNILSILHGHGPLDLKFVYDGGEKWVASNKVCPKKVYISDAETAEEIRRATSFGENSLFNCGHISFGKQLLLQINFCCQEVMQNIKITSLVDQPLLDACSV